jgi:hypothetical protein
MLNVDDYGDLTRTVKYEYKTNGKTLKDTIVYSVAEVSKTAKKITEGDEEDTKAESIAEWVTRVTREAKLFKRDGVELTATEAAKNYDDMNGIISAIFRTILENETKN